MMNKPLLQSYLIGGFSMLSLFLIWCVTIAEWDHQETIKLWIEEGCFKKNVGCTMSQDPIIVFSSLGIGVVGFLIISYCYCRFDIETPIGEVKKYANY